MDIFHPEGLAAVCFSQLVIFSLRQLARLKLDMSHQILILRAVIRLEHLWYKKI